MAYTTINKHTDYFNTKTWTGTSDATTSVTGVGFQPDWVWIKNRDVADDHMLFDAVRGVTKRLFSNSTNAEGTDASTLTSFDSDGFTTGNSRAAGGDAGNRMVSWNWKGNGAGSSNTDGTITSTVSVNTTAGFSIVKWSGNAVNGASIGHGLGVQPEMIIVKAINKVDNWCVYHKDVALNGSSFLRLHTTDASYNAFVAFTGEPTSSVFYVSDAAATNQTSYDYIAYCFTSKTGYSKFGSYTGNGNADGTFVYTGFKPAWLLVKRKSGTQDWQQFDNQINPYNVATLCMRPNQYNGEQTGNAMDLLSNGFKNRLTGSSVNSSGDTYIYLAVGQSLVGSNNVPCTAR
jgi:hypothetical protein